MKKVAVIMAVGAVMAVVLVIIPSTRQELHWRWTLSRDQARSYQSYLQAWPEGRHQAQAQERYEQRSWSAAQAENTLPAFARYLESFPEGPHVEAAGEKLESLHWQAALAGNTFASLQKYLEQYPAGRFVEEAQAKQAELLADDAPFDEAQRQGTPAAYEKFLADFPGHRRAAAARAALRDQEGRDIVDLLEEGKIEVATTGSGIQSVSLKVRRLVSYPLAVRVPAGTYFVSQNPSAQNMVTTEEAKTTLRTEDWVSLSPPAACANRSRDVPGTGDSFAVQRSPHQAELIMLMPVLDQAGVSYPVRQAAVWIVTDNASYADLGALVMSAGPLNRGGARQIRELETAQAMKLCEKAGLNITGKAIWNDRMIILAGLQDQELKKWILHIIQMQSLPPE